jgi:NAD(P)-dependent dehydrogenase (short-subunit alcohol dehydrogenase family)
MSGVETERDVLVVTGTGGMGMAVARRLGPGRCVVLADNDPGQLEESAETLSAEGHEVRAVPTDISDATAVQTLAAKVMDAGPLGCAVHTAGVSPVQASPERIVMVDVMGTAHLLDELLDAVRPGSVCVCIASMAATMVALDAEVERLLATAPTSILATLPVLDLATMDQGSAYAIAKRANQLRVEGASRTWGARGGRVVSISPGVISTPMGRQELSGPSGGLMRDLIRRSGTGRVGTPDDIAAVVEFLVSRAATFVTGTDILVDGGAVAAFRYGDED